MKYKKITVLIILVMFLFICSLSTISAANQTINSTSTGGIAQGITNTGTGDTLFLQPGTYNKTGQDTNINVNKNITIQGNGSTNSVIIDAQGLSRIFFIVGNTNVTFINMTFINGYAVDGGGITASNGNVTLSLINCTFINNSATNSGGAVTVGNRANFTSTGCNFVNNSAVNYGGAIYSSYNGTLYVSNCNFTDNIALYGGGIHITSDGKLTVVRSNFVNNSATDYGGAISFYYGATTNTLNVADSNFTSNSAKYGGAIASFYLGSNVSIGNATVVRSNFVNNSATDYGGAIFNNCSMFVSGNTMMGNSAGLGQMIYNNGNIGVLNLTYLSNSTVKTSKGSTVTVYATLTDDMGNTVTGQDISFYVDGVFIANATSIEGKANTTYLVTQGPGSVLPVTGDYAGHEGYSIVLKNGALLIPKIPTNITINVPENLRVSQNTTLESKLTDKDGNSIANATIDFYVDGKKVGSAITDANGVAKLNYTFNKAGKPTITAKYAGNETYEASNAVTQTTVSKIKTNLELETNNETITATLTDEDGNPIANKKITIKIKGKTFTGTTDSNGQVIIKFPNANKYKVTAKFVGDDQYAPSSATVPGESEPNKPTSTISTSGKVTMKETGIPIMAILLTLITSLGLAIMKKDE